MTVKYLRFPTDIVIQLLAWLLLVFVIIMFYFMLRYHANGRQTALFATTVVALRPVSLLLNLLAVAVNGLVIGFGLYLVHQIFIRFTGWRAVLLAVAALVSMIWNARVISFIGYMTCCGSFASWYFSLSPDSNRLQHATLKAFLRAISTSLGSLALASFLLSLFSLVQLVLKLLKKCDSCVKKARKKLHSYVNIYAIVHMALWGDSFIEASKAAKRATNDQAPIVRSTEVNLILYAAAMGSIASACTLGLTATRYHEADYNGMPRYAYLVFTYLLVFIVVFWVAWTALQPLHAVLTTTFFCYCEDKTPLEHAHTSFLKLFKPKQKAATVAKPSAAKKTAGKATAAKKNTATTKPTAKVSSSATGGTKEKTTVVSSNATVSAESSSAVAPKVDV